MRGPKSTALITRWAQADTGTPHVKTACERVRMVGGKTKQNKNNLNQWQPEDDCWFCLRYCRRCWTESAAAPFPTLSSSETQSSEGSIQCPRKSKTVHTNPTYLYTQTYIFIHRKDHPMCNHSHIRAKKFNILSEYQNTLQQPARKKTKPFHTFSM